MLRQTPGSRGRILVVDDDTVCTETLSRMLVDDGFRVTIANDGEEALKSMAEDPPDVVVTDLQMPVMDGFRLLRAARGRYPGLPFIVMSGMHRGAASLLEGEALAFIAKPFDVDEIVSVLDAAMQLREARLAV